LTPVFSSITLACRVVAEVNSSSLVKVSLTGEGQRHAAYQPSSAAYNLYLATGQSEFMAAKGRVRVYSVSPRDIRFRFSK